MSRCQRRDPSAVVRGAGWAVLSTTILVLIPPTPVYADGPTAAIVNGEKIPLSEVDAVIAERPRGLAPLTPGQLRQFRMEILAGLIDTRLLGQFLDKHGPAVDPAEVDQQIAALAEAQKANGLSFEDYLKETGQTEAQIRAGMLNMLRFAAYVEKNAPDEQLRKYYEANKPFFDKITVRASHIVIRTSAEEPISERQEARKQLMAFRQQIRDEKLSFEDAAKQYSHCPTGPKGGDVGYFTRKWMTDEAFAATAFGMQVGEMSDVVETEFGFHLIKVTDRTKGEPSTFDTSKTEVRDAYGEELRQKLLEKLRVEAEVSITLP